MSESLEGRAFNFQLNNSGELTCPDARSSGKMTDFNPRLLRLSRRVHVAASAIVMLMASLVLVGWMLDIATLKSILPDLVTMKANTALGLLLAGTSLWLLGTEPRHRWIRRAAQVCAGTVVLIGLLTLSEYLLGWDLGIDQLLFRNEPGAVATPYPGRMAPHTAFNFLLVGSALLLSLRSRHRDRLAQALTLLAALISFSVLVGYLYSVGYSYGPFSSTGMAVDTALAFAVLCVGILHARPDQGLMALITNNSPGGLMARRLLPVSAGALLALGWFVEAGERASLYGCAFDSALFSVAGMVVLTALIWWSAGSLYRLDTKRRQAEGALRESEQRLRLSLSAAKMGTWDVDLQTGRISISNRLAAIFGLPPDVTWHNRDDWRRLVHPDDQERIEAVFQRAVAGQGEYDVEYRIIWPDGAVHWVTSKGISLRDETGQAVRAIGVTQDITARKQAEEERERLLAREQAARAEAEAVNRLKDEFLATVSHELRTPMAAILGFADLLRSGELDEVNAARAIQIIDRNAQAQAQLIEDLLDVSRIVTGKLTLNVRPVELVPIIYVALDTIKPAAESKGISLETKLNPTVGPISGDPDRLQQVVWNLLSNAIKFTPRGGRVQVRLERVRSQTQIIVSDTGVGMSPEFLPYVFDRFRQADSSTTRKYGGLGLGLAIVRYLVEMHGGTVHAESPGQGRGATFTVQLPLMMRDAVADSSGDDAERASAIAEPNRSVDSTINLGGVRVLAVDDEPDARALISTVLEQRGAEVRAVASAREAMEELESWKPDVIVADIGMPDEDGYWLIHQIRALAPDRGGRVPAVALTAYARAGDRERALSAGYQVHVPKPVQPTELAAVIASLTGRIVKNASA
ncbi:MAG: response regulator [Acidobacteria bacterium]|nr:response regulator [Acidobacteriota bacterium]